MDLQELLKVKLIVYDFDGVMTDNTFILDQYGCESVVLNRSDGLAVSEFKKLGLEQIIISTEINSIVLKRAEKLKIFCLNGVESKINVLKDYLKGKRINKENVLYVGNDLNDLEAMNYIGIPACPSDAYPEIRKISFLITNAKGGKGVIREIYELYRQQIICNPA